MDNNSVQKYGWHSADQPGSSDYIKPKIIEIIAALGVKRIIDIGAGNGNLCGDVANMGYDVVGVEYDKGGCDIASKSYPKIPFYNFGVQDEPLELLKSEALFDVAVSTEVIEHLFAPHLLPIYAHAVLKNQGYLIVSTPYHGYLKNLALSIFDKWDKHHTALWHGGHIKFWSRNTLTELLETNGFKVVSFYGVGRAKMLWKSMILVAQKK
jgi:2-polyprenyl-3-methyl-5-hydroxy-6-metoxy-1,4-benzoquinol methylase